ncbi:MAG TPA: ABC transporter substrate-binding protein [Dehalococcoidia bacterium]|nr:ABC transporter substrate-binding protein [Dehalococcoidia bacterium]
MVKKIIILLVSSLMVMSLLFISCGTSEGDETGTETGDGEFSDPKTPKYGGIHITMGTDPQGFDPRVVMSHFTNTLPTTHELLLTGDWSKGPAGTGETDWQLGFLGRTDLFAGSLAESWELVDDETIRYHIRKGVKWQDKSPVNGREFTADDAVWNIDMEWTTEGSNLDIFFKEEDHLISVKKIDDWTIETKFPAHATAIHIMEDSCRILMLPPEITDMYGDQQDWRHSTGTGPYLLTDYVTGSHIVYEKNPNYWGNDPNHPENKLPYLDGIRQLIIPDQSSQLAAFRTGKIFNYTTTWENAKDLLNQCPDLEYIETYGRGTALCGRVDKPELPFKDVRVRQALNLAVDQQEILDAYYEGHGYLKGWPFYPIKAHEPFFTPLEEMPEEVQELFEYHPDKAKQLLAEAGYPNGFKTKATCSSADADFMAMIREYLLKVDIDMEIEPLEPSIYFSVMRARTHDEMIYKWTSMYWGPWLMHEVRADSSDCVSFYEHERTLEVYDIINRNLGKNDDYWIKKLKDLTPFMLEESWGIFLPVPSSYIMWWPWLQNYYGCTHVGYAEFGKYVFYVWMDTDMKKSMGY